MAAACARYARRAACPVTFWPGAPGSALSTVARLEQGHRTSCRGRTLARLSAALDADPSTITPG